MSNEMEKNEGLPFSSAQDLLDKVKTLEGEEGLQPILELLQGKEISDDFLKEISVLIGQECRRASLKPITRDLYREIRLAIRDRFGRLGKGDQAFFQNQKFRQPSVKRE